MLTLFYSFLQRNEEDETKPAIQQVNFSYSVHQRENPRMFFVNVFGFGHDFTQMNVKYNLDGTKLINTSAIHVVKQRVRSELKWKNMMHYIDNESGFIFNMLITLMVYCINICDEEWHADKHGKMMINIR